MKFKLRKASDYSFVGMDVDVNTIEDLIKISDDYGGENLIIEFGEEPEITIYDEFVE